MKEADILSFSPVMGWLSLGSTVVTADPFLLLLLLLQVSGHDHKQYKYVVSVLFMP